MAMALQRRMPQEVDDGPEAKRGRYEVTPALQSAMMQVNVSERKTGLPGPTVHLTGHGGEVFGCEFSPSGNHLASASFDNKVFLWNVYGDCDNYGVLAGHANAVLEVHWSYDGEQLYSCSADKACAIWDAESGKRIKKLSGHMGIVNSVQGSKKGDPLMCSGSDDGCTKMWDCRIRRCVHTFEHQYQILGVCFDQNNEKIFAGCLDNTVRVYDARQRGAEELYVLKGHKDSITGVSLSPDGEKLLTNSMDNSCRIWDVRNFVEGSRAMSLLQGHMHNFEKNLLKCNWSADGKFVSAGSGDRQVVVWDSTSREMKYRLPGHTGTVNCVAFHPKEGIIASASSDKSLYMGELS